ncbi:hypothetical protein C942_02315 [Photobacterium marinum]|uniref:HNH nuclease domain-containing protein n=1 Tax=Photobacterium marinum TaxID=1056511 RepID=L8JB17_9GAMM|nr:HNH endonuclease domain-containing protein [Photobacterium marinum]ELR64622.1 hypothetical protein C942_02315 [Photobacterium marinum]
MSKQSIPPTVRAGIHKVFNEKCFYCNEPINYSELEIDHVIPESLLSDDKKKEKALRKYALESDFEILSYKNLVASCGDCNNKKRDLLLHTGFVAIALAVIESKLPKLKEYLTSKKKDKTLASLLKSMATSLENGAFTQEELIASLSNIFEFPNSHPSLVNSLKPVEESPVEFQERDDELDIVWIQHAVDKRGMNKIPSEDVLNALYSGITFRADRHHCAKERYFVETESGLRVVFEIRKNKVVIVTCYYVHKDYLAKYQKYEKIKSPINKLS